MLSPHIQKLKDLHTGPADTRTIAEIVASAQANAKERDAQIQESYANTSYKHSFKHKVEPYEQATARFREIWKRFVAAERVARNNPDWSPSVCEEQARAIRNLIAYFSGNPCELDQTKGIYLYGNVGSGKSMLMRMFAEFTAGTSFEFYYTDFEIELSLIKADANRPYLENLRQSNRCFDEVGMSSAEVNRYGNHADVLNEVIYHRNYRFTTYRQKTHIVTNISPADISQILNERNVSRAGAMMQPVAYFGESNRK